LENRLGKRLRELRKQKGWSQKQLGGQAKMSQGHISQLEREEVRNPSPPILLRLAKALGVYPDDLFNAAGYPTDRNLDGDERFEPRVDPDLVRFLAGLSRDQQRHILLLLEGMEERNRA